MKLQSTKIKTISAILISRIEFLTVLQIGLLGKANVGKSTFFSAATETPVATGNFPFTTIETQYWCSICKNKLCLHIF